MFSSPKSFKCLGPDCSSDTLYSCDFCKSMVCFSHLPADRHQCKSHFLRTPQNPQVPCPICGQVIVENRGEFIDEKVDRHIRAGCPIVKRTLNLSQEAMNENSRSVSNGKPAPTLATVSSPSAIQTSAVSQISVTQPIQHENSSAKLFFEKITTNKVTPNETLRQFLGGISRKRNISRKVKEESPQEIERMRSVYLGLKHLYQQEQALHHPIYFSTALFYACRMILVGQGAAINFGHELKILLNESTELASPFSKVLEDYLKQICAQILLSVHDVAFWTLIIEQLGLFIQVNMEASRITDYVKEQLCFAAYFVKASYEQEHNIYIPLVAKLAQLNVIVFKSKFKTWALENSTKQPLISSVMDRARLLAFAVASKISVQVNLTNQTPPCS